MKNTYFFVLLLLSGNMLIAQSGIDYVFIQMNQLGRLKQSLKKEIELIDDTESVKWAFKVKNSNSRLNSEYEKIGDSLDVVIQRNETSINLASNILMNFARAKYYSFSFFPYGASCDQSGLSELENKILNLIKSGDFLNDSRVKYNRLSSEYYMLSDALKKAEESTDSIKSKMKNKRDTSELSIQLQQTYKTIDSLEYVLKPYDYQMEQLSIFKLNSSSFNDLENENENEKYLAIEPFKKCFIDISSPGENINANDFFKNKLLVNDIIEMILKRERISSIESPIVSKDDLISLGDIYTHDSNVNYKFLLEVDDVFRFKEIIDLLNIEEEYRVMYFIMLKEYNRDLLQLSTKELVDLREDDLVYMKYSNLIWLPTFESMRIRPINLERKFHGEIEVWSFLEAFEKGLISIDYIEVKN